MGELKKAAAEQFWLFQLFSLRGIFLSLERVLCDRNEAVFRKQKSDFYEDGGDRFGEFVGALETKDVAGPHFAICSYFCNTPVHLFCNLSR